MTVWNTTATAPYSFSTTLTLSVYDWGFLGAELPGEGEGLPVEYVTFGTLMLTPCHLPVLAAGYVLDWEMRHLPVRYLEPGQTGLTSDATGLSRPESVLWLVGLERYPHLTTRSNQYLAVAITPMPIACTTCSNSGKGRQQ